ncbi:TetR/AcrR family transcriptional regulator [Nonomuraea gerenzanensis]|uniref:Transcriptional regulator, TetR family n=1 Tax=Nonomuraea gerenzanensis TaxID=93944 RepID=A0A1M4EFQ3_9ACTN|nr:TetR/AcrR family transcriptional regulator [Nonomuraea gerenzanensis]UBU09235.1 TetR/AcrR family transcriptional regulator [Nonomuraea gerenzanensis]SBO97632.1 Transcriptional regulator, TetR family [Nonomuraea gerenzanensis]
MAGTTPAASSRSDAVRNRRLLLDAAAELFAERGVEVSIGEIAQRAGVGKGTVFRHFAAKDELLAAIMLGILGRLADTGDELLADGDPGPALRRFMTVCVETFVGDRAFCETVGRPSLQHAEVREAIHRLCEVAERLTARARQAGAVRPGITGIDVVLLVSGVQHTAEPLLAAEPEAWRRYLELAIDGITVDTGRELPHPPPSSLRLD